MGISPYSLNRTNIARLPYVKYLPQCDISVYEMKCAARRAFLNLKRNDNRQNVATCFSARKRYFASCASFLHTFFWQDRKKYARGATVAVSPQ